MSAALHVVPGQRALNDEQRAVVRAVWRDAFLTALHREGHRYLFALRGKEVAFQANTLVGNLASIDDLTGEMPECAWYFGVAERAESKGHGTQNLRALNALFVDIDFKDTPEARARAILAAFPLPPSAIVASGGGLHVYWLLSEPLYLNNGAAPRGKAILRTLAKEVSADLGSAEPAHILRVPGTLNHKYSPPRPVILEHVDASRRYALDQLLAVLPAIPPTALERPRGPVEHGLTDAARVQAAQRYLAGQPPAVEKQGGDAHTFSVCAAVAIGHDLDVDNAVKALTEWNERCLPPWSEPELRRKLHNAEHYGTEQRGARLRTRRLVVTPASQIKARAVRWLWEGRLPFGELTLEAGREGIGKSTVAYDIAAQVTRGRLAGCCQGQPRAVIVVTGEDSWEHTIVPRLLAAGADLELVVRVNVEMRDLGTMELSLPDDIAELDQVVRELDAALILLDPVISRLSRKIDTHKDADVRSALEPTVRLAHATGASVLGIIHVNKGSSNDPLNTVMGSRAFVAVARTVLYVVRDPDDADDKVRLLGVAKNNLGRSDLPTLKFTIQSATVGTTEEGDSIEAGRIVWLGEAERSIRQAVEDASDGIKSTAIADATTWLREYMRGGPGWALSSTIKAAGQREGFHGKTLERASKRVGLVVSRSRQQKGPTVWALAGVTVPDQLELERM